MNKWAFCFNDILMVMKILNKREIKRLIESVIREQAIGPMVAILEKTGMRKHVDEYISIVEKITDAIEFFTTDSDYKVAKEDVDELRQKVIALNPKDSPDPITSKDVIFLNKFYEFITKSEEYRGLSKEEFGDMVWQDAMRRVKSGWWDPSDQGPRGPQAGSKKKSIDLDTLLALNNL